MTRKAHFLSRLGNQGISTTIWRGVSVRPCRLDCRVSGVPPGRSSFTRKASGTGRSQVVDFKREGA